MKRVLILLAILWNLPPAHAVPLHLDIHGMVGYTGLQIAAGSPTLFQGGGGGTLGYKLGSFFVGGSGDYRLVNQYSEVTPEVGNNKGTTINLFSPTLGFAAGPILLKVDYQFLTQYKQSLPLSDGQKVSYESPSGFRAGLHYKYTPAVYFGGFYETLKFRKQKLTGGTVNDASLSMFVIGASLTLKVSSLWESEFDFSY